MQARRIDVFFYGLFMDESLLKEKGISPSSRRLASLENFRLVIGNRATLIPGASEPVHGVLFALSHEEIDKLYSDTSVNVYRPEAVSVRLVDGSVVPALCFNLPEPPAAEERNEPYAMKLKELAKQIGLPSDYVDSIK